MTRIQPHQHRMIRRHPDNISFACFSEIARVPEACLALFERLRFPKGLICPWRGVCEPNSRFVRHRSRPGLYACGACRRQFSLTSGTAIHRTKLPLGQWLRAIWLVVSSSNGISARKLGEMLDVTYKVAWHLGHRIRAMMAEGASVLGSLGGVVELDEASRAVRRSQTNPSGGRVRADRRPGRAAMPVRLPGRRTGPQALRRRFPMRQSAAARLGPSC